MARKPELVLGLAAGNTMIGLYAELVKLQQAGSLDLSHIITFALDEYVGLEPDHPCSFNTFLRKELLEPVGVQAKNCFFPDGLAEDIDRSCREYEKKIKAAGGIDLQILGIGADGHIAFNEPMSSLGSRTRIKTLTEQTRQDNSAAFGSDQAVPHHAITMGLGTIVESRCCLLLAFGMKKASAVAQAVEGPVTAMVPASVLQLHPDVRIIADENAASLLQHRQHYRYTYKNKPDWQKY